MAKGAMAAGKTARQEVKAAGGARQDARAAAQTARQDYRSNLNALSPRAQDVFAPALAQAAAQRPQKAAPRGAQKAERIQDRISNVMGKASNVVGKMALPGANMDRLGGRLDNLNARQNNLTNKLLAHNQRMGGVAPQMPLFAQGELTGGIADVLPGVSVPPVQIQPLASQQAGVGMLGGGAAPIGQPVQGINPGDILRRLREANSPRTDYNIYDQMGNVVGSI